MTPSRNGHWSLSNARPQPMSLSLKIPNRPTTLMMRKQSTHFGIGHSFAVWKRKAHKGRRLQDSHPPHLEMLETGQRQSGLHS